MAKTSPIEFFRQVRTDAKRITWPTRKETTVGTMAVFVMVFLASVFLFTADQLIAYLVHKIMELGL